MTEKYIELLQLVPQAPEWKIKWQDIENSRCHVFIEKMKNTHQNPVWHGEDDVWTHTQMVCEELVKLSSYRLLERRKQEEVFLAALLHDLGKIPCTRWEDGRWTSPNHTSVGAKMAREFLWKEYGVCGRKVLQEFRETICNLIRYHSIPPHILDQNRPEHRLIKIAANGELAPDFSIELLCVLVEADMRGRVYKDTEESLEILNICREMAAEYECFEKPVQFPNAFSEYAYLSGRESSRGRSYMTIHGEK